MLDLRELYQDIILDHYKKPRNFRKLESARHVEGFNPLCGDKITVYLKLEDGKIKDVSFQGTGCAISTASASIMTQSVKGKTMPEAEALFETFHHLIIGKSTSPPSPPSQGRDKEGVPTADLDKLAVFSGVREFPLRVKCATLAWHAFHAALEGKETTVSTE